jgi:hypothetical protein
MKSELEYMADFDPNSTTTRTKIYQALQRSGVTEIPGNVKAQIDEMIRAIEDGRSSEKKMLEDIRSETNKSSGVLKTLAQIFKFGGSEMDKHYPSKKK